MDDFTIGVTAIVNDLDHNGCDSRAFKAFRAAAKENTVSDTKKTFLDVLMDLATNQPK